MAPARFSVPTPRWAGLVSASLDAFKDGADPGAGESDSSAAEDTAGTAPADGTEVDDLISKAAVAVEGHAASAQLSRFRMARLSADAAAIANEAPAVPGKPSRGVTSGTRLDVQR